jgi:2-polyprenyl-3-methyl-5-hydroxy-6-metoxy-1,4-benzoquinol methylase
MQKRHIDREIYFNEQVYTTDKYVIPFIEKSMKVDSSLTILEIGCGEAGNLKPFVDMGCKCVGVDLNAHKVGLAEEFYKEEPNNKNITLIVDDIFNRVNDYPNGFDIVILRDVIEHIHNQEKFLKSLKALLSDKGKIFFGFPPWQNPFGGHQQICQSKLLSVTPYFHLLPKFLYKMVLKAFGENDKTVTDLLEIKDTGISIERFQKILRKENWKVDLKTYFFINPNYEIKFKLKPRESYSVISSIPVLRNFMVTACYFLISKK